MDLRKLGSQDLLIGVALEKKSVNQGIINGNSLFLWAYMFIFKGYCSWFHLCLCRYLPTEDSKRK